MATERAYDVVLFGATGFTGTLTAEYLARTVPAGFRWALAGRNRQKLVALRDRLATIRPAAAELELLYADVTDAASLREVATSSRVVITTVGPYTHYGEPLVAACADAGTDYVDLCGEPEFVDTMYLRHDTRARQTGARLVHACGFDSIPHDLGALFTVRQLPHNQPIRLAGHVRAGGTISGGTFASTLAAFSRPLAMSRAARQRRRAEPRPVGRRVRAVTGTPHRDQGSGLWAAPLPTLDPQIIARSAAALPDYGPDFTYRHYASLKHLPTLAAGAVGLAALIGLALLPPARNALASLRKPGEGPSEEKRAKSWFTVRFVGEAAGRRVVTQVSGGDPGYGETAKMLAESALCLALDELPPTAGQVTTATAMGDALLKRLTDAGLRFDIIEA
jgi:short subunit dehydrogenase-like uncharacterized protein